MSKEKRLTVQDVIDALRKAPKDAIVVSATYRNNLPTVIASYTTPGQSPATVVYIADDLTDVDAAQAPNVQKRILTPWTSWIKCPHCGAGFNPDEHTEYDDEKYYVCPYCKCCIDS